MTNAANLVRTLPVRCLLLGHPGAGKTGALAPLLNAGFKMRMLDFDGNLEPLLQFTDPGKLSNLDVLHFEDKMRLGSGFMEPVGIPTAFKNALNALDNWVYEEGGEKIDLGCSKDWGPDTIVVVDSLTKMGDAAFRRAQKMLNKNPTNTTQQVWGLAMAEQLAFVERLTSTSNRHHTIVLAHMKIIAPKDSGKGDSELTEDLKKRMAEVVPTRYYPRALGYELPQTIGGEFSTALVMETEYVGMKARRYLKSIPSELLDLKIPAPNFPAKLDIADGMLTVFKALSPGSVELVMKGGGDGNRGTEGTAVGVAAAVV